MLDTNIKTLIDSGENETPQSALNGIIALGRENGFVTMDEILSAYSNFDAELHDLEEVFAALMSAQIPIRDDVNSDAETEEEDLSNGSQGEAKQNGSNGSAKSNIRIDDMVGLYFKDAAHIPLLTAEEEIHLAKLIHKGWDARKQLLNGRDKSFEEQEEIRAAIQEGDEASRQLVLANTRLVISVAKKYMGRGVPFLDLIQEGNIGLLRALKKFDYQRGYKFSTYATWWIRQAVTRTLANQSRTIRIPVHMADRISRLFKVKQELQQNLGREPHADELAAAMDIQPEKINKMLHYAKHTISLDTPIGFEDDAELGDFIEDAESPTPEEAAADRLTREALEKIFREKVPPREARVLRLRYGLPDGNVHTLAEIGQKMGISRERVRQIEAQAFRRLRRMETRARLQSYRNGIKSGGFLYQG